MLHYFNKLTNPVFSPFSTNLPTLTFVYSAIIINDSFIMFIVEVMYHVFMYSTDHSGPQIIVRDTDCFARGAKRKRQLVY